MRDKPGVLVDDIATRIETLIVSGELSPGARLPEQTLAMSLGISRGPLREAIRTLEGRRLVERTPNAGVRVTQLSLEDLEQLLVTREALEGMAARGAAENMTAAEIRSLREVAAKTEQMHEQGLGAVFAGGADNDFHRRIALGSRNRWIVRALCEDLYALLRMYRLNAALRPVDESHATHQEHRDIIECIHQRDADAAEKAMRTHIRNGKVRLLTQIRSRSPSTTPAAD